MSERWRESCHLSVELEIRFASRRFIRAQGKILEWTFWLTEAELLFLSSQSCIVSSSITLHLTGHITANCIKVISGIM